MPAPEDFKAKLLEKTRLASDTQRTHTAQRTQPNHHYSATIIGDQQILSSDSAKDFSNNMSHQIREWILEGPGKFHVSEIDKEFDLRTRREKNLRSRVVCDLQLNNNIERNTSKKGYYEVIDTTLEKINFKNKEEQPYSLWLPFDLHRMVKIFPKNIIVIAGEPNAGKTALLLNIVRNNMAGKEIVYFSSEMGESEFHERLSKFEGMDMDDWDFEPYERSEAFHHVLRPDGFNIIDFLEVHEDFYAVGGRLREIHDKLKNGIAIVAVQKNPGCRAGLGGGRGMEKPRLYISLSENGSRGGICEVVKAKSYLGPNPNGKQLEFSIKDGWQILSNTVWHYPDRTDRNNKHQY